MNDTLMYFLKVNIAIALFYLFYRLFFAGDTFWKTRRNYLLFSILISFAYPLLSIENWLEKQEPVQIFVTNYTMLQEFTVTANQKPAINYEMILYALYGLVVFGLLIKLFVQLFSILKFRIQGKTQTIQNTRIIAINKAITPFSFFGSIYMNPALHTEVETPQILAHELTHVRQAHSMDVLISELLCIAFWINPAVWLLKREIRQNLEFLADDKVIESGFDTKSYQYHLLQLAYQTPENKLVNKFNVSPLKKRITMMNQQKTSKAGLLKYSLIVPLALALVLSSNAENIINAATKTLTSTKEVVTGQKTEHQEVSETTKTGTDPVIPLKEKSDEKIYDIVEIMPQYPGGEKALLDYISRNIKYPIDAQEKGIQGHIVVRFIVSKSGKVENAEVLRSLYPSLDTAGLKVVNSLPDWIPAKQNGKKVNVYYTLPISFKLNEKSDGKIYNIVEKMPQYPGGEKALLDYISHNIKYPIDAQEKGIQGQIVVRFIVSKSGKVENPEVLRSLYPSIDAEGLKVVNSLPDWIPAEQNGQKVNVYYTLPISFKLDGGTIVSSNLNNYAASAKFTTKTLHAGEGIPLYIVDGKEISGSDFNAIKTENIQTWNELKREAAIKEYGDKGKNGVIIITMKK